MILAVMIIVTWIVGGLIFVAGMTQHAANDDNSDFQDCLLGVRHGELAAIVALTMFIAVWPAVFLAVKLAR